MKNGHALFGKGVNDPSGDWLCCTLSLISNNIYDTYKIACCEINNFFVLLHWDSDIKFVVSLNRDDKNE